MMHIGSFRFVDGQYVGRLSTLSLDVALRILPAPPGDTGRAPDWRVEHDDGSATQVGVGWSHRSARAGAFVNLQLDCPALPRPLRAHLVRADGTADEYLLLWPMRARRVAKG